MAVLPKRKLTAAEYLEIERAAEFRSEFHDGEMFAMAGGTANHNVVIGNLRGELRNRLKGRSCQTYSENLIVEVLSTSTEALDRGKKFQHYRSIPSLVEYGLVSQREPLIERFTRQDDGSWNLVVFAGLDATRRFESVDADIPLAEIYENAEFGPEPGPAEATGAPEIG